MRKIEIIILFNLNKSKTNVFLINAREGVELALVNIFISPRVFLTGLGV